MGHAAPVIRQLDETVVNRIAAGEVIQRPASALKELLENSLDAGSTQIGVVVKEGGCKLLQITDNGHGIRKADLPILCHRHTTSKLKAFEDLETINTLGFRGEALCSISCVSNLTVTTMTPGALHGWRVSYKDSEPVLPGPKPVASVQGTTITVEDLFYNVPTRRKALKSAAEEYARVVDVVSRYAVFKTGVAFTSKRHGESRADVSTLATASRLDNIRAVYGSAVAKELLPVSLQVGQPLSAQLGVDAPCSFTLEGYVSSANYVAKSSTFILFVNERLVECPPLRRALEATYAAVLPKAGRPFLFLDLRLPPRHLEVNMHPTKREVGLLNQDELVEAVRSALEGLLQASNSTRTFVQQHLPSAPATIQASLSPPPGPGEPLHERQNELEPTPQRAGSSGGAEARGATAGSSQGTYRPDKLVRTDSKAQTMEGFLASQYTTPRAAALAGSVGRKRALPADSRPAPPDLTLDPLTDSYVDLTHQATGSAAANMPHAPSVPLGVRSELDSIRGLAAQVEAQAHEGLTELFRNHTLVGMADDTRALLQHQTKLYLVDVRKLSYDLFYQQVLRSWEGCERIMLEPRPRICDLMVLALQMAQAAGTWQDVQSNDQVCDLTLQLLREKGPMLTEYLGLEVDAQGYLISLPQLLLGHTPDLGYLPDLILALAREVDWEEEEPCFRTIAQVLAEFYSLKAPCMPVYQRNQITGQQLDSMHATVAPPAQAAQAAVEHARSAAEVPAQEQHDILTAAGVGPERQQNRGTELPQDATMTDASLQLAETCDIEAAAIEVEQGEAVQTDAAMQDVQENTSKSTAGPGSADNAEQAGAASQHQGQQQQQAGLATDDELNARLWMIKQVLFPAFRSLLRPSKARAMDGTVIQVTALEKLYRIFERC